MALILIVEPDLTLLAQVAQLAWNDLRAEVMSVGSADRARAALADAIPDVVLMSPLLSAHDEATIAATLRDLGPSAAHVQVLTIPILAAPPVETSTKRGLLGFLSKRPDQDASHGCVWDLFAKQIASYVGLAESQRKAELQPAVPALEPLQPDIPPHLIPAAAALVEDVVVDDEDLWAPIPLDELLREPERAPADVRVLAPIVASPLPPVKQTSPPKKRTPRTRSVPDEWGLFDPDQCEFGALVATLDEMTGHREASHRGDGSPRRALTSHA